MRRVIVFTNLTLDGVMQAPGRPDEDRRGGFQHGGWAAPFAAMSQAGGNLSDSGPLLMGRRTYEDFHGYWPNQKDNPFTEVLNNTPKYVSSTTLKEPLAWSNSTLLKGNVPEEVGEAQSPAGEGLPRDGQRRIRPDAYEA